jgi:hypothetical protein
VEENAQMRSAAGVALDAWRRRMVERGQDLLDAASTRTHEVRERIEEIPDLDVFGRELLGERAS